MALNSMYCVDVPLHAASGLFMFTLPPKRGNTRKHKLIKKGEWLCYVSFEKHEPRNEQNVKKTPFQTVTQQL